MMNGTMVNMHNHHEMHDHDSMDHMMHADGNCNLFGNIGITMWFIINITIILSTLPFIFKFLRSHIKHRRDAQAPFHQFFPAILFVIITFIVLLSDTASIYFYNCNYTWWMMFMLIFGFTYTLQIILVLIIFFFRVYFIFRSSQFQLSKITICFYTVTFIPLPICVAIVEFWYHISHHSKMSRIVLGILYICNILCMLSLMVLFTKKLRETYKYLPSVDKSKSETHQLFIGIMTRTVILTAISMIFTLIASLGIIFIDQMETVGMIIVGLLVIIDVYTNFICILLSFSYFNEMYYKLCSCIDVKINRFCRYLNADCDMIVAEMVPNKSCSPSSPEADTELSV